jgi:hypothetical protein
MAKHIKTTLSLSILALWCGLAWADSPVRTLFNRNNFIEEGRPYASQGFWSNPANALYGKTVATWSEEDFAALDAELRRSIYALSISDNPFRNGQIDKLQRVVDLIPSFKQWAQKAREGGGITEAQPSGKAAQPGTATGTTTDYKKWLRAAWSYGLPAGIAALLAGLGGWFAYAYHQRTRVPVCPKCRTRDHKMLSVGTKTFKSVLFNGRRKCYCAACGYKWIQR